jgi:hypothetical protein
MKPTYYPRGMTNVRDGDELAFACVEPNKTVHCHRPCASDTGAVSLRFCIVLICWLFECYPCVLFFFGPPIYSYPTYTPSTQLRSYQRLLVHARHTPVRHQLGVFWVLNQSNDNLIRLRNHSHSTGPFNSIRSELDTHVMILSRQ